ncbi:isopentenyl-diphosphate Delta-isomerase [Clostridium thermarum]|uniref:isopentenyl-diphosphate Delta-isomerase n=1 Tax=Clostridium thermarum TaxID=1716543 RepID=UPI0013D4A947|nr:isopentenyl-diphosphate Delta-isomerase [Clostridium thermarum]
MHDEMNIILVDKDDNKIGLMSKKDAHLTGALHRAFSIYVFNSQGEFLLQRRAKTKYHSGGLWSNTCCSHPVPNVPMDELVHHRLMEEMGFDCHLNKIFCYYYSTSFENNLMEHEYVHVYIGFYDGTPQPNITEAEDWKWMPIDALIDDIRDNPKNYTYWFKKAFKRVLTHLNASKIISD